jgi:mono/diheme cytochrome c family protein
MRVLGTIIVFVAVLVGGAFVIMYTGVINVGAINKDPAMVAWFMDTAMTKSVHRHAANIVAPALSDSNRIKTGFQHYDEMCVVCHGAPGIPFTEISVGLNPDPPSLAEAANDWTPAELFWIVKSGVKMTGMPGFKTTHSDDAIWDIVAFVKRLPGMTPEQYSSLKKQVGPLTEETESPSDK